MNINKVFFLRKPDTNEIRQIYLGYAWPAIIFNVLYLLFKKDWKWAGIFFALDILAALLPEDYAGLAVFSIGLIICFFYNKIKLKELTAKGWVLTENSEDVLNQYKTQKAEKAQARKEKRKEAYENLAKIESNGGIFHRQVRCPKCRSTNIQIVGQHKKGFSVGKAAAGVALTGGIGSLAGFAGKKTKKVDMICMNCGKQFKYKK